MDKNTLHNNRMKAENLIAKEYADVRMLQDKLQRYDSKIQDCYRNKETTTVATLQGLIDSQEISRRRLKECYARINMLKKQQKNDFRAIRAMNHIARFP